MSASGLALERTHVSIVSDEKNRSSSTNVTMQPGGQFIVRGLVPGDYTLRVDTGVQSSKAAPSREVAYVPFRLESSNVEGLAGSSTGIGQPSS